MFFGIVIYFVYFFISKMWDIALVLLILNYVKLEFWIVLKFYTWRTFFFLIMQHLNSHNRQLLMWLTTFLYWMLVYELDFDLKKVLFLNYVSDSRCKPITDFNGGEAKAFGTNYYYYQYAFIFLFAWNHFFSLNMSTYNTSMFILSFNLFFLKIQDLVGIHICAKRCMFIFDAITEAVNT